MELCYANNKKSLFRKYNRGITSLVNKHQLFRDFVGHGTLKIPKNLDILLPNGYAQKIDEKTGLLNVTPRAIYTPKLYPVLQLVDFLNTIKNPFIEKEQLIAWSLGLIKNPRFYLTLLALGVPKSLILTLPVFIGDTVDFDPDAHPESTSCDGIAYRQTTEAWSTKLAGAGTGGSADGTYDLQLYLYGSTGAWATYTKSIMLFDTSWLATGADSYSAASLILYGTAYNAPFGSQGIVVVSANPGSNTDIVASDYNAAVYGSTDFGRYAGASWNASSTNTLSLNASGFANVTETMSKFGCRWIWDFDGGTPTGAVAEAYMLWQSAEDANPPILRVTYVPVETSIKGSMMLMGVGT